jgi:CHASE3 domain sensor protein
VTHTREVLETFESMLSLLKDAETATRGFVITGEERYLTPYHGAYAPLRDALAHARELTRDNATQHERLTKLEPMLGQRVELLTRL